MDSQLRKSVVVGDGAVGVSWFTMRYMNNLIFGPAIQGKTCLLIALARGQFPRDYVPTVFDSHTIDIEVNGECIKLTIFDIPGQGDYQDRLRPLSYPGAHAFLMCFSIGSPDSLDNVPERWNEEIMHFGAGKVPRFLVGCKKDLRHDPTTLSYLAQGSQVPVTTEQGRCMAKAIGAEYFECSSKTGEGVREFFARVTESMEAEKAVRIEDRRRSYQRPWYRGCIVV